jgi:pantothenate synthetase
MKNIATSLVNLLGTILLFLVSGCASNDVDHRSISPSPVAVVQDIDRAKLAASNLNKFVSPDGRQAAKSLDTALNGAYRSLLDYSIKVDAMGKELVKAQDEVTYWHNKQIKGLKEIWLWRSIALASILAVAAYIGLKTSWRFFL